MPEPLIALAIFGAGLVAGFINVMAGGGSTLTVPMLIFAGLDPTVANGTNRVAIFVQNVSAIASFRQEKFVRFKISLFMALFCLPGAITGAILASKIDDALFQKILGIIMIGIIISMIIPKSKQKYDLDPDTQPPWTIYLAMFGIGFYGGFIQVGVGFILMAALYNILRVNLVWVNVHKVFIIFLYTIPALIIFFYFGKVDLLLGLILAAGNALGAWWAAKLSVKKGDKVIKYVLMVAVLIMALKLLEVF